MKSKQIKDSLHQSLLSSNNLKKRMDKIDKGIELLIKNNEDIKSIISIGSYSQGSIDQFSDIDLLIFTDNTKKYADENYDWEAVLGCSLSVIKMGYPMSDKIKIVLEDGLMYDLLIINMNKVKIVYTYSFLKKYKLTWMIPKFFRYRLEEVLALFYDPIKKGSKIHVDKMNVKKFISKLHLLFNDYNHHKIDQKKFTFCYKRFWHACYPAAIKLMRNEIGLVHVRYDNILKRQLLKMIEWKILSEKKIDVFYDSKGIKEWGGEDLKERFLKTVSSHENIAEGLMDTAKFFQEYAIHVAKKNDFDLDDRLGDFVINFLKINKEYYTKEYVLH